MSTLSTQCVDFEHTVCRLTACKVNNAKLRQEPAAPYPMGDGVVDLVADSLRQYRTYPIQSVGR
eukprot:3718039-Rhodomonas_salina.2